MVYAPSPVLTVTVEHHGEVPSLHLHAGGQGVRQARMLAGLGARAVLCTTLGGEVGRVLSGLLAAEDFAVRAVNQEVSHDELVAAGRASDESLPTLLAAARQLRAEGAAAVVVSRAEQPAIAWIDDGPHQVEAPTWEEADPRGAGDWMTAAVAAMLAGGAGLAEAVRFGAAAGAVNVTRHGLGTGHVEAVSEVAKRVRLVPVPAEGSGDVA